MGILATLCRRLNVCGQISCRPVFLGGISLSALYEILSFFSLGGQLGHQKVRPGSGKPIFKRQEKNIELFFSDPEGFG